MSAREFVYRILAALADHRRSDQVHRAWVTVPLMRKEKVPKRCDRSTHSPRRERGGQALLMSEAAGRCRFLVNAVRENEDLRGMQTHTMPEGDGHGLREMELLDAQVGVGGGDVSGCE